MDKKEIKDICNPLYKTNYLFGLIDQHVYFVSDFDRVEKLKVCNVSIYKKFDGNVGIELICTPVEAVGFIVYNHDDQSLNYDDLGKSWFFSFPDAKRKLYKQKKSKQITLFDLM